MEAFEDEDFDVETDKLSKTLPMGLTSILGTRLAIRIPPSSFLSAIPHASLSPKGRV